MIEVSGGAMKLVGPKGSILVQEHDETTLKLAMLFEGQCEGLGPAKAAQKYGYSRQRYYQILDQYVEKGADGLRSMKTGPKSNYRRTDEVVRQVIRHRFLDPDVSAEVIAQKLNQGGRGISARSVERVISEYGLQKKTPSLPSTHRTDES
jgi:transposase